MKKILIVGISGQLGSALADVFQDSEWEVYGTYHKNAPKSGVTKTFKLDITDQEKVKDLLALTAPEVVINTASMTWVDGCETDTERASAVNVQGNQNLLQGCSPSTLFVYISTYYLFDGTKGFYQESDDPNPLNHYGKTKWQAEQDSLTRKNSLSIRTTKIFSYGYDDRNFIARLHHSLQEGKITRQANDQFTNPILAEDLAHIIKLLILRQRNGVYHLGGSDYVSNYEFAVRFAEIMGLNQNFIKAVTSEELEQAALRPKRCGLAVNKMRNEGVQLCNLKDSFLRLREKIREQ